MIGRCRHMANEYYGNWALWRDCHRATSPHRHIATLHYCHTCDRQYHHMAQWQPGIMAKLSPCHIVTLHYCHIVEWPECHIIEFGFAAMLADRDEADIRTRAHIRNIAGWHSVSASDAKALRARQVNRSEPPHPIR